MKKFGKFEIGGEKEQKLNPRTITLMRRSDRVDVIVNGLSVFGFRDDSDVVYRYKSVADGAGLRNMGEGICGVTAKPKGFDFDWDRGWGSY